MFIIPYGFKLLEVFSKQMSAQKSVCDIKPSQKAKTLQQFLMVKYKLLVNSLHFYKKCILNNYSQLLLK